MSISRWMANGLIMCCSWGTLGFTIPVRKSVDLEWLRWWESHSGGAKNNQYGRNEVRVQHATGDKVLCPVLAARWIMSAANHFGTSLDEPALSTGSGYGVTAVWVIKVLKALAK